MAIYYVAPDGNDANDGTTWAKRKRTLNGAEDIPVAAGDTVYVAPGTYREMLTVDVSGSAGNPITYIGDYTGAHTDGVGGVVRITASNDDKTYSRARCITGNSIRHYRSYHGFVLNGGSAEGVGQNAFGDYSVLDSCYIEVFGGSGITINPGANTKINNCFFYGARGSGNIFIQFWAPSLSDYATSITNCMFSGIERAIFATNVGGITIDNCLFYHCDASYSTAIGSTDYPSYIRNSIILGGYTALSTNGLGVLVEDYNLINSRTPRQNVAIGANSVDYMPLFDTRWFFEMVHGGKVLSPFDLASYSQLVGLAGISPTATDMRGTGAIGGVRERGPLEYDPDLIVKGGGSGGVSRSRIIGGA